MITDLLFQLGTWPKR